MANAYFHCKIVDTIAICIQKDLIDPVTPITQADFVTGAIPDLMVNDAQDITLFKYTGTQSNGSVDGVLAATNNQVYSVIAKLALTTTTDVEQFSVELNDFSTVNTTDATITNIGPAFPVGIKKYIHIDFQVMAARTDSEDYFRVGIWYDFKRKTGSLSLLKDTEYDKLQVGGLEGYLEVSGNSIQAKVKGQIAEDWTWTITKYEITQIIIPEDT